MEKELGIKQLMTLNTKYETKYSYSYTNNKPGICKRINIRLNKLEEELLLNPIIIIELDETTDLEFDPTNIINSIELSIGSSQIDKLYLNQLKIYQAIKGLDIKKIDSKIFYPVPIDSFIQNEGLLVSKLSYYCINMCIEFTSNPCITCIKDIHVRTEALTMKTNPDYFEISKYYINNSKNKDICSYLDEYLDKNDSTIVKIRQNQLQTISLSSDISNCKYNIWFNHFVEKFFIYFEDVTNDSIYKNKSFDKITFIANGLNVLEYDYTTLVCDNEEKNIGYKLPQGVFQIDFDKFYSTNLSKIDKFTIELCGITIPNNNIQFCICANSINYLEYRKNTCGIIYSS